MKRIFFYSFEDSFFCHFTFFVQWPKIVQEHLLCNFKALLNVWQPDLWNFSTAELMVLNMNSDSSYLKIQTHEISPPICQFCQGEMWTFSAFCCLCCSFLSGWVEVPQRNHLGAGSAALCRLLVLKEDSLCLPRFSPAPSST